MSLGSLEDTMPSIWFKASQVDPDKALGSTGDYTIKSIETVPGKNAKGLPEVAINIIFEESDKQWGVNIGNRKTIASLHGEKLDGWIGKRIQLMIVLRHSPSENKDVPSLMVGGAIPPDAGGNAEEPPF